MKINSWIWMNELARKQQNNTTVPISLTWRKSQLIKKVRKLEGKLVFDKVIECLCVIRAEEKRLLVWSGIDRRCRWRVGLCKEGYRRCVVWWDWSEVLRDWRVLVEGERAMKREGTVWGWANDVSFFIDGEMVVVLALWVRLGWHRWWVNGGREDLKVWLELL